MISNTAIIHKNVELGINVIIEDYCIIGVIPSHLKESPKKTTIGDNSIIRSHTVIYCGNTIGNNFSTGNKANIRENNMIGCNVSIGTLSVIEHNITIEDNVRIHTQVFIPEYTYLKRGCWIGPNTCLTNAKRPLSAFVKDNLIGPIISEDAIIGANVTILPGVNIGKCSFIGAGSVVTKDVEKNVTVVGNPAKILVLK